MIVAIKTTLKPRLKPMLKLPVAAIAAAVTAIAALLPAGPAQALSLIEAYQSALQNDPTYLAARMENQAGQENQVIGRSGLLPAVSGSYARSRTRADQWSLNQFTRKDDLTHPKYTSDSYNVSLRQPLVNFEAVARYYQGVAQTRYSEALFEGRGQELLLRVLGAYVEALFTEDQLTLATAQRDSYAEQLRLNERLLKSGEGTKTDFLETQAKLDQAEAQLIELRDAQLNARNALGAITGGEVTRLDALGAQFALLPMQPSSFEEWKALALKHNSELVAHEHAIESASQDIKRSRAGHAPRLDFVASYGRSMSESLTTLNNTYLTRTLGIQVSVPIYSGGYVNAVSRQSVANHARAKAEMTAKTDKVLIELRKQFNLVQSSAVRIAATQKAVDSAQALVQATTQSIKGGVRINADLLNAETQLSSSRRDLAQARYNYLLSYMRLRLAAGTLSADDLRQLASNFGGR